MNTPNMTDDQSVKHTSTESKPLHEKLIPQTSIRFLFVLIGGSALMMVVFRAAGDGLPVARILTLLIMTVAGCFAVYAALFLVANVFSSTTAPIVQALESASSSRPSPTTTTDNRNTDHQEVS
jgi:hypothetical protein